MNTLRGLHNYLHVIPDETIPKISSMISLDGVFLVPQQIMITVIKFFNKIQLQNPTSSKIILSIFIINYICHH